MTTTPMTASSSGSAPSNVRPSAVRYLAPACVLMLSLGACGDGKAHDPIACTTAVEAGTCTLSYEPTFANVFERTLRPSCGKGGAACHTARARQGGLAFEEADDAYRALLDGKVRPGDSACSALTVRVAASDPNIRMPPGRAISAEEQCALARWITEGAKR